MRPKSAIQNRCDADSFGFESWCFSLPKTQPKPPTKKCVFRKGNGTPAISEKSRLVKYYSIGPVKSDFKQVKSGVFKLPIGRDQTMPVLFCSSKCNVWEGKK